MEMQYTNPRIGRSLVFSFISCLAEATTYDRMWYNFNVRSKTNAWSGLWLDAVLRLCEMVAEEGGREEEEEEEEEYDDDDDDDER